MAHNKLLLLLCFCFFFFRNRALKEENQRNYILFPLTFSHSASKLGPTGADPVLCRG